MINILCNFVIIIIFFLSEIREHRKKNIETLC